MKYMECKECRELFPLKFCGEISVEQDNNLRNHLASCEECRKEFTATEKLWNLMGELPLAEPSERLSENFSKALTSLEKKSKVRRSAINSLIEKIAASLAFPAIPRIAVSILLIVAGLGIGYYLNPAGKVASSYNRQIDSLSSQVSDLKQIMMLSLLRDQSASMRLQAVAYTEELNGIDRKVIEALLLTLNQDPNVNVRLATLEALARFAGDPFAREGLVRSIENQESPIVQSAIADVMVKLNEKSSLEPLKKLLGRKDLNESVKQNIEQSIRKLI